MSLFHQINEDIKQAMRAKEQAKLLALRAVKSELLLAKTAKGGKDEIPEAEGIKILQKLVKQRKDSATLYKEQGRQDLEEKETFEASVIEKYLPEQLSDADLTKIIQGIISQVGAQSPKDMGKVMGVASKQLAGKAEGKLIAQKVKELLAAL